MESEMRFEDYVQEDTLWVLLNAKWNCKPPLKSLKMQVVFVVLNEYITANFVGMYLGRPL